MTFFDYLLTGSYLFTAAMGWKMLATLNRIERKLEHMDGLIDGWNLDERVTRLERRLGMGGSYGDDHA